MPFNKAKEEIMTLLNDDATLEPQGYEPAAAKRLPREAYRCGMRLDAAHTIVRNKLKDTSVKQSEVTKLSRMYFDGKTIDPNCFRELDRFWAAATVFRTIDKTRCNLLAERFGLDAMLFKKYRKQDIIRYGGHKPWEYDEECFKLFQKL